MKLDFHAPTPQEYFESLVQSDEHFPLLEAAISLGQDEEPDLDVQAVLAKVDQLCERLKRRIPADAAAMHKLRMLNQFFFSDMGFAVNNNHYYDPDNSYMASVLHTRRGIPISLAVLWLELAHHLGLSASGVSFPGHFLVKVSLPQGQVVIDPLTGHSLSREELSERLEPLRQTGLDEDMVPLGLFLQSAEPREIVARMLRNLKEIHTTQEDWPRLVAVLDRLVLLLPEAWETYRDRGLVRAELGHLDGAMADLENYLANAEYPADHAMISDRLDELRSEKNR
jgi:regulator of sirC expression with transglutaminase-like and TPR domain